jgi:uncharacterized protein YegP (UPF0339 family)
MEDNMAAKFEIFVDRKKQYRFRLKATNGEIIAVGESYETKAACLKGIRSIQKNAPIAEIVGPDKTGKKVPGAIRGALKATSAQKES